MIHWVLNTFWERSNRKWDGFYPNGVDFIHYAWNWRLGRSCVALGALLGVLGALLGRLEALLGRFWMLLGRSWDFLGCSRGLLGRILGMNFVDRGGLPGVF